MEDSIREELAKVFVPSKKPKKYIVLTKTRIESEIIYEFWKKIGVKVFDNACKNYSTVRLIDVYYSKAIFKVCYYLWHPLTSNEERIKQSHSYNEFRGIVSKSLFLYDTFCRLEKIIKNKKNKRL